MPGKGKGKDRELSRRDFLRLTGLAAAGTVIVACGTPAGQQAPDAATDIAGTEPDVAATEAPAEAATEAPAEAAPADAPTPTREVPRGNPTEVPREQSLILMWPPTGVGIGNPYAAGFNHQHGNSAMLEPLFFYSAFAEEPDVPWLAESYEYADDDMQVTIKIRNGVEWSDGTPFTARDVAFTLNMLRQNELLAYGTDMQEWVSEATAVDDATVNIAFTKAAPRFVFDFLSSKFDTGIFYVPEHVFKDVEDVANFLFYDPGQNWPLVTGPYKIVDWTPQQELLDVREDWWAVKTGFATLPAIRRIVVVPRTDDTGMAQGVINNELDSTLDLRPPLMKTVVESNPAVITHTGRESPFGYTDWWPNSLWFNCMAEPWNDPEVRRAVNHAINREQVVEIGYEGAGSGTVLPFPEFPSLQKYFEAAQPALEKYPVDAYDLAKVDEIMMGKGFTKDGEGLWVGTDGNRPEATIYGFDIFADYGPVVAEQLRAAGFDSSFQAPPDAYDRMANGTGNLFLFGNGAAIADAFPTFDTYYHSKRSRPIGEGGGITPRWVNEEFDKIVDEMALFPVADDRAMPLYVQAIEILLRELPAIPVVQWLHRIPYNTTYWTDWPTADNSYVNGAFWHKTFPLMLHRMKAAS